MGISKQSIEDLKKRSKISDFVLSTTTGKLRGTKGMALCPFHGEKTASMSFTDVENLFHCFGCKMGGDIYKYVQEIHNLEFQDAVELVAEKYGFTLTYTETSQNNDFKNFQQKINLIDEYFKEMMDSEKSKKAKEYLTSRKFNEQDIKRYDISFIDSNVGDFQKFCDKNQISNFDLKKLGFISSNDNFLFRNRIMFPILNFRSETIAYGGRALEDFGPKYLNSSDSVLYKKNRNLYFTKEFISSVKKKGYAILVEGYFDVLSLNQLGYSNSSSPSGTALTIQQLEAISRYTNKILLCFDNDEAGLKATERVLEIKNQVSNQLEIHCLNLPEKYKDISEIYEENGDIFSNILKDNLEIIEFLIDKFIESTSDKKSIFNYFMKITTNLSPLEVDVSLDLLSSKLNTAKDILKKELKFQTSDEKEDVTEQSISSISIFKDLIIAEMISNEFSPNEEIDQLIELNPEFKKLVDGIKKENSKKEEYLNISYTKEQHSEAVSRLYLHFANLKIDELIQEFEESKDKNFKLLQKVEDIKKKKEIYQNTI
ncbi:DNA primase [Acidimicrobiaceae bacterium]|nr:DNA primase [Acidimicrobiaceae bacterium]